MKALVRPCDEESSSVSTDDGFFFRDQQIDVNQKIHCKDSLKETCCKDDNSSLDSNSKKAIQQDEKSMKEEEVATNVQENKHNKTILEGTSIRHNF